MSGKPRVLHLEDSWAISLTLEQEYRRAGMEPNVVRNTRDGLKALKNEQFDVYVTDLLVPHHKEGRMEITPLSLLLIAHEWLIRCSNAPCPREWTFLGFETMG